MTTIPIVLDAATLRFYERVAENAGELSLEALHHAK